MECDIPTSVSSAQVGTWASILTLLDSLNDSRLNYSLHNYYLINYSLQTVKICLPSTPKLGGGVNGNYICVWSLKTLLHTYVVCRVSTRRKGFSAN